MEKLASYIWVDALVRRAQIGGASAFIVQKGDEMRGDVLIKVACLDGRAAFLAPAPVMSETHSFDWLPTPGEWSTDREVDEHINRRRGYDSDLWVIEIEDRQGRHFLTENVNGERESPVPGGKS